MNSVRRHDISEWFGGTRRCDTFEQAMAAAEHDLDRTPYVTIWPFADRWMVITWASAVVN